MKTTEMLGTIEEDKSLSAKNVRAKNALPLELHEILDRYELLYPEVEQLSDLRRAVIDQDIASIFRLCKSQPILRSAVLDKNLHSIFKLFPDSNDDLRKAVIEENIHSIFRLLENYPVTGGHSDDLRRAVTEGNSYSLFRMYPEDNERLHVLRTAIVNKNIRSVFKLLPHNEDIRRAVTEENLHSLFRLLDNDDLRKLVLQDNKWKLWPLLEKYTNTQFTQAFKNFFVNNVEIDRDCFSRGQLRSKQWLVQELSKLDVKLGTVFLCAGWYATLATMLFESDIEVDKIRSFDIDPDVVDIAKVFNKPWVMKDWQFQASIEDIHAIDYESHTYTVTRSDGSTAQLTDCPTTVINTSCEHIENFEEWYAKIPMNTLVILQSNNFTSVKEHVNCVKSIKEFRKMAPMTGPLFAGELKLDKYKRFMLIGYR